MRADTASASRAAEPRQQPVAGRVAEGVVVLLEAVEVEQDAARAGRAARGELELHAPGRPSGCAGCAGPVSESVRASRAAPGSTRWFSRKASAIRTSASSSAHAARLTAATLHALEVVVHQQLRPPRAPHADRHGDHHASRGSLRSACARGCQAASATSSADAGQSASSRRALHVRPLAVWTR